MSNTMASDNVPRTNELATSRKSPSDKLVENNGSIYIISNFFFDSGALSWHTTYQKADSTLWIFKKWVINIHAPRCITHVRSWFDPFCARLSDGSGNVLWTTLAIPIFTPTKTTSTPLRVANTGMLTIMSIRVFSDVKHFSMVSTTYMAHRPARFWKKINSAISMSTIMQTFYEKGLSKTWKLKLGKPWKNLPVLSRMLLYMVFNIDDVKSPLKRRS